MYQRGFVAANDGNLSMRVSAKELLATPTGVSKGFMTPESLVLINNQGEPLGLGKVSTEIKMHLAVYRARPDVNGVVHAHPPISTAFSLSQTPMNPGLLAEVVVALGSIPVADYRTPSTSALAETVQQYIVNNNAVLMANHGAITVGDTILQAYYRMETLEHCALINLISHLLGGGRALPADEVARLTSMREFYGLPAQRPESGSEPTKPANLNNLDLENIVRSVITEVLSYRSR